jgi:Kef-type K+ transport system membrane component KefB
LPLFADDAIAALRTLPVDALMLPVLVQLAVIVAAARVCGVIARRLGQPAVVGEIVAGLLLGKSLFAWVWPAGFAAVFEPTLPGVPPDLTAAAFPKIFQALSQLGLLFLMFLVGLGFHTEHLRAKGLAAAAVAAAGVGVPFVLGAGLAPLLHPHLEPLPTGQAVPLVGLTLFLGAALAVTAIPTLGRMMQEFGITDTRVGTIAVAAAAVADTLVWVFLAGIGTVADADGGWAGPLVMLGLTLGFGAVLVLVVPRTLGVYLDRSVRANGGKLGVTPLAVLLVGLLACGIATNRIGISAVFGAFLFGATLSGRPEPRKAVTARLGDVVNAFFLPVFFTSVGLRTDLTALGGLWWVAAAVLAVGVAGKFGGCAVAARWAGYGWREAGVLGALMNTRGLMGLVVAAIGSDAGLIPPSLFSALVLVAVLTTAMAGPLVVWLGRGTEIEGPLRANGFLRERPATAEPTPERAAA